MKVEATVWAVAVETAYVPAASCLTKALAGQVLLHRHNASALLRIGVAKDEQGVFQAPASVGNSPQLSHYTLLSGFKKDSL